MISAARELESLVNDSFILAMVSTGISGQRGVNVGAIVRTGARSDKIAVVAPADTATIPIAAVVAI